MSQYVAVTGCAGFIGRVVLRQLLERGDYVYGVDCLNYAADPRYIEQMQRAYPDRFCFIPRDIRALEQWPDVSAVLHLAAESHVDRSLSNPLAFVETNVLGTAHLLQMTYAKRQHGMPHFIQVSTDECYGSRRWRDAAYEATPLEPSSPYAASKAAADLLVQAWGHTYGLPYTIVRMTNCYGEGQYPEKLIPKTVRSLALGRPVPIHGEGTAERQWLNVEDAASAILFVLDHFDTSPDVLNVGGNTHATVRQVVERIAQIMGKPLQTERRERPGLDERYIVNDDAIRRAGWTPKGDFFTDLPQIVENEAKTFRF